MELKEKKLNSKLVYDGSFLKVNKDEVLLPNGNKSTREYILHPGASCILAEYNNKFIIETQYRHPVGEVVYELPAGKIDNGEDPLNTAIRELEEETGFKSNDLYYLGSIYTSFGFSNEVIHLYYAKNLVKTNTNLDKDEFLYIELYSLEEILNMINDGIIKDSKTISTISLYMMKKDLIKK